MVCLGGTAGLGVGVGVLIGLMVARVNRAVIGLLRLHAYPVLEPSGDAAVVPSEVWSGCAWGVCVCVCVFTHTHEYMHACAFSTSSEERT